MDSISVSALGLAGTIPIHSIPPGSSRHFLAEGFRSGQLVQRGEAVADLDAGVQRSISISMKSLLGSFVLKVPLGLDNPQGIEGGKLVYSGKNVHDSLSLEGNLPVREFASGPVPLSQTYFFRVELWDARKKVMFRGEDSVWIDEQNPEVSMDLQSLYSTVSLQLSLSLTPSIGGTAILQGSTTRAPIHSGDLLILELLPNPKTSGTDWEYTEILNTTADTLTLDGCKLAKDSQASGSTTSAMLDGCIVAPGSYAVIGRDSVTNRNCNAQAFSLSNSGQPVVITCSGSLIDSISYSTSDSLNLFPVVEGASIEVPLSRHALRHQASAWCKGSENVSLGSITILGSPGKDALCQ
jgi:hypothetical protein